MTNTNNNEIAWKLATRLGCLANQLDLWADECRSSGQSSRQVQPIRDIAREIRSELHGFVPTKEAFEELLTIRQRSLNELRQIVAKHHAIPNYLAEEIEYHEKCMAELKQDLTSSPAQSSSQSLS